MAITLSRRQPREWPLLVLALALVFVVCIPLQQWLASNPGEGTPWAGRLERAGRLLIGPEQIACYCCFTWGAFILLSRFLEVRRQRQAFQLGLLPGSLKHLDGLGDVLRRVVSHHLHSYPSSAFGDRGEFDEIGDQSKFHQLLPH